MSINNVSKIKLVEDKSTFISLDEYRFLTDEEFSRFKVNYDESYRYKFIKYNDDIYYVKNKPDRSDLLLNEILSERVSSFFDLDTVSSKLYSFKENNEYLDDCVLLTKKIMEDKKTYGNFDIFINAIEKYNIGLENFNNIFSYKNPSSNDIININDNSLEKLKLDLKKMLVADFVCAQYNRRKENYMFECNNSNVKLMPLYNYSDSFYAAIHKKNFGLLEFDIYSHKVKRQIRKDDIFQELLVKVGDINYDEMIDEVKDEFGLHFTDSDLYLSKRRIDDAKYIIKRDKLVK